MKEDKASERERAEDRVVGDETNERVKERKIDR